MSAVNHRQRALATLRAKLDARKPPSDKKNPKPLGGPTDKPEPSNKQEKTPKGPSKKEVVSERQREKYADADLIGFSPTGKILPKVWNDETELKRVKTYELKQLEAAECIIVGSKMLNDIAEQKVTSATLTQMLALAVSLREIGDEVDNNLLSVPAEGYGTQDKNLAVDSTETTEEAINQLRVIELLKKRRKAKQDKTKQASVALKAVDGAGASAEVDSVPQGNPAAYCYIAAYLMGLAIKTTESLTESLPKFASRYSGWYAMGEDVVKYFSLPQQSAEAIKATLGRKPELVNTWVMWVAYNENHGNLDRHPRRLLEYLAGKVFSYTGLHAYTLTLDIQKVSKCNMCDLLQQLNCPLTRQAVTAIDDVIRHYEVTEKHSDRTTYFRYARVFDPGYFAILQTKKCAYLVYLLAKSYKEMSPSGATMSDPLKIYGIQGLGAQVRSRLDAVSERLVDTIFRSKC